MKLPEFSVKQPVAALMLFLALILIGGYSATKLSIDMYPDIDPPIVSIITSWPGASASDVKSEITEKIEDFVNSINNLDTLRSKSVDNLSVVTCQFDWGTDLDIAINDIRDSLEIAKSKIPDDADDPLPFKFSSSVAPIMFMSITAEKNWTRLYHYADKVIGDELKRVPGVGAVILKGGLLRRINVYFEREKIEGFHLSLAMINKTLAAENLNIPAGNVKTGPKDYFIRVPGRYRSVDEIGNTIVGHYNGKSIYLKDVAQIKDEFEPPEENAWANGKRGMIIMLQKQTGKNTVAVADLVKKRLAELKTRLPEDFEIKIMTDTSKDIKSSINNLKTSLILGIILIVLVNIVFLRRLRTVFIVVLVIPTSLIIAFILMKAFGYTINLATLMALAIASGMVVDNGIVVLENIIRHVEKGERPATSAMFGASEMGLAITAATMTTVIIFVPLIFLTGFAGIIFKPLGFVLVATLLASLIVALMLIPMMASKLITSSAGQEKESKGMWGRFYILSEKMFNRIENFYRSILEWALGHTKTVIVLAVTIFISGISLIPFLSTSFFPEMDSGDVNIAFRLPEGSRIDETNAMLAKIMEKTKNVIRPEELLNSYGYDGVGKEGFGVALGFDQGPNVGSVSFKLVDRDKRSRSVKEIGNELRYEVNKIPGLDKFQISVKSSTDAALGGGTRPVSLEIQSDDLQKSLSVAQAIKNLMEKIPGVVDVDITQKDPRPEVWVEIDREKAASMGLNTAIIGGTLRNYLYGQEATEYRDAGESFDVFTRFTEEDKNRIDSLSTIPVFTSDGRMVRLDSVAKIVHGFGPIEIQRKNRQNIVKVEADLYKKSLGEVSTILNDKIKHIELPVGVSIKFGGDVEEQKKAFKDLAMLLIIGIMLVYMLMASLFGNLRDPFIIMFSLPFAFTGVFYAFYFTGTTLGIMSFMGVIMLMGIVVNNAIVLLDYIHLLQKRGNSLFQAVTQAGRDRLRPVLMTTFTTFFGLLPMAVSSKVGAEAWNPLGITVLGGLSVSTIVTLVLIPTIYYMFERRKQPAFRKEA